MTPGASSVLPHLILCGLRASINPGAVSLTQLREDQQHATLGRAGQSGPYKDWFHVPGQEHLGGLLGVVYRDHQLGT